MSTPNSNDISRLATLTKVNSQGSNGNLRGRKGLNAQRANFEENDTELFDAIRNEPSNALLQSTNSQTNIKPLSPPLAPPNNVPSRTSGMASGSGPGVANSDTTGDSLIDNTSIVSERPAGTTSSLNNAAPRHVNGRPVTTSGGSNIGTPDNSDFSSASTSFESTDSPVTSNNNGGSNTDVGSSKNSSAVGSFSVVAAAGGTFLVCIALVAVAIGFKRRQRTIQKSSPEFKKSNSRVSSTTSSSSSTDENNYPNKRSLFASGSFSWGDMGVKSLMSSDAKGTLSNINKGNNNTNNNNNTSIPSLPTNATTQQVHMTSTNLSNYNDTSQVLTQRSSMASSFDWGDMGATRVLSPDAKGVTNNNTTTSNTKKKKQQQRHSESLGWGQATFLIRSDTGNLNNDDDDDSNQQQQQQQGKGSFNELLSPNSSSGSSSTKATPKTNISDADTLNITGSGGGLQEDARRRSCDSGFSWRELEGTFKSPDAGKSVQEKM